MTTHTSQEVTAEFEPLFAQYIHAVQAQFNHIPRLQQEIRGLAKQLAIEPHTRKTEKSSP